MSRWVIIVKKVQILELDCPLDYDSEEILRHALTHLKLAPWDDKHAPSIWEAHPLPDLDCLPEDDPATGAVFASRQPAEPIPPAGEE